MATDTEDRTRDAHNIDEVGPDREQPRSSHRVYVISDLHLGGCGPAEDSEAPRGFRIFTQSRVLAAFLAEITRKCTPDTTTELVINGDFVDFLAEEDSCQNASGSWTAVKHDPVVAGRILKSIFDREGTVFDALADFVHAGHQLTLVLGNHDIELSYPMLRSLLAQRLGVPQASLRFVFDGEAYTLGTDVLIEHGNRYDRFNQNDYDALRRVRSLQSRRQPVPPELSLTPSPGSRLVASVINPIKKDYPFVDLLKPENEAMVPLLLALEPGVLDKVSAVVSALVPATRRGMRDPLLTRYRGDIGARVTSGSTLREFLASELVDLRRTDDAPENTVDDFCQAIGGADASLRSQAAGDIAAFQSVKALGSRTLGLIALLRADRHDSIADRLPALRMALNRLAKDQTFDTEIEPAGSYRDAVQALGDVGFRLVLFGHTHIPRDVQIGTCRYLNTGSWVDCLRFPPVLVQPDADAELLRQFVERLRQGDYSDWIKFDPIYARIDLGPDGRLVDAELRRFSPD